MAWCVDLEQKGIVGRNGTGRNFSGILYRRDIIGMLQRLRVSSTGGVDRGNCGKKKDGFKCRAQREGLQGKVIEAENSS